MQFVLEQTGLSGLSDSSDQEALLSKLNSLLILIASFSSTIVVCVHTWSRTNLAEKELKE